MKPEYVLTEDYEDLKAGQPLKLTHRTTILSLVNICIDHPVTGELFYVPITKIRPNTNE